MSDGFVSSFTTNSLTFYSYWNNTVLVFFTLVSVTLGIFISFGSRIKADTRQELSRRIVSWFQFVCVLQVCTSCLLASLITSPAPSYQSYLYAGSVITGMWCLFRVLCSFLSGISGFFVVAHPMFRYFTLACQLGIASIDCISEIYYVANIDCILTGLCVNTSSSYGLSVLRWSYVFAIRDLISFGLNLLGFTLVMCLLWNLGWTGTIPMPIYEEPRDFSKQNRNIEFED